MIDYMIKIYQKKYKISMPNIFTLRYDKEIYRIAKKGQKFKHYLVILQNII